ncbi:MAG: restriction endonuclease, partial [Oscillospiraceae bacterium]|nr:restriction endonuclease [Oscillospiraceae bacterium]
MIKLIQKSSYIKSGSGGASAYMNYIAKREGVEKLHGRGSATQRQRELIQNLLRDFPDSKELFEYADYKNHPTLGTASAFISAALEYNISNLQAGDVYMKYIAERPRVERHGDHGLFSRAENVSLPLYLQEIQNHKGNIWTIIYSLHREDAARLSFDHADAWRKLLLRHETDMAKAMKIPEDQ